MTQCISMLRETFAEFMKILPEGLITSQDDLADRAGFADAEKALLKAGTTKLEAMICMALDAKAPKKHILQHASTFGNEFKVMWQEHVHADLVDAARKCGVEIPVVAKAASSSVGSGTTVTTPAKAASSSVGSGTTPDGSEGTKKRKSVEISGDPAEAAGPKRGTHP